MVDALWAAFAVLLIVAEFFTAVACYSLRGFSRSRLLQICRQRENESRFQLILLRGERNLLSLELFNALVRITLISLIVLWLSFQRTSADQSAGFSSLEAWFFTLIVAALLFSSVIVARSVAKVAGNAFLYRYWPILNVLFLACRMLVSLAREVDKFLHRLSGLAEPSLGDVAVLKEEIRAVVDEGHHGGILEARARTMIHRVMELQEEDVASIMTPRTDMFCIQASVGLEPARRELLKAGHTRVPVIGKSPDDMIGILYAKDLLKYIGDEDTQHSLTEIARKPFYIPETTSIDKLLETMNHRRVHLAIVLDEYGGVAGLVTMEDVLEEIVGEIVDEYDASEDEPIQCIDINTTEVDARVHIDDLNEQFEYDLPEGSDYETIGGFTFSHLGYIPKSEDKFTWRQLRFTVLEADERKIIKLRIEVDRSLAAAVAEEG